MAMDAKQREFVERFLPWRLEALEDFNLVLRLRPQPTPPERIEIYFDGKLRITGRAASFMNPVIEAGVIHCRVLLEFMGLAVHPQDRTRLTERRQSPRNDDLYINNFSNAAGPLERVTPGDAIAPCTGDKTKAERALAYVIRIANKGMAHSTVGLHVESDDHDLLEIASRAVPVLITNHFYLPLGLTPPPSVITRTPRRP